MCKNATLEGIYTVPKSENYWLFRAGKKARYFDNFIATKRIGLGWDKIKKIEQVRDFNILKKEVEILYPDSKTPWNIYNKINKFTNELKSGDLILMPDIEKRRVAFGRVLGDNLKIEKVLEQKRLLPVDESVNSSPEEDLGVLNKFRNVHWIKVIEKKEISPIILNYLFAPHSLSKMNNEISYEVNKLINDIFILDNKLHIKYKIRTEKDVHPRDMKNFFTLLDYAEKVINIVDETEERIATKTSVNSPGTITAVATVTIASLAILTHILNGGSLDIHLWGLKFKSKGGKTLFDYLEQKHRHKLELLNRKMEKELPKGEREKLKKDLDVRTPKIDD